MVSSANVLHNEHLALLQSAKSSYMKLLYGILSLCEMGHPSHHHCCHRSLNQVLPDVRV